MSDIEAWIEQAAADLGTPLPACARELAAKVVGDARAAFVEGNPRVWWLALKRPFKCRTSVGTSLAAVLPTKEERVWFIPETDDDSLPVYDMRPEDIEYVRLNCPAFEHYVVDKSYRWIVIESDHDQFIISAAEST